MCAFDSRSDWLILRLWLNHCTSVLPHLRIPLVHVRRIYFKYIALECKYYGITLGSELHNKPASELMCTTLKRHIHKWDFITQNLTQLPLHSLCTLFKSDPLGMKSVCDRIIFPVSHRAHYPNLLVFSCNKLLHKNRMSFMIQILFLSF